MQELLRPRGSPLVLGDSTERPARVAVFTSGTGIYAQAVLDHERELRQLHRSVYKVAVIVTDNKNPKNDSWRLADRTKVPLLYRNFQAFAMGEWHYYDTVSRDLAPHNVDLIVLAGSDRMGEPLLGEYAGRIVKMSITSLVRGGFLQTSADPQGIMVAIMNGAIAIRPETYLIEGPKPHERSFIRSGRGFEIILPPNIRPDEFRTPYLRPVMRRLGEAYHNLLSHRGDWKVLPESIPEIISESLAVSGSTATRLFNAARAHMPHLPFIHRPESD